MRYVKKTYKKIDNGGEELNINDGVEGSLRAFQLIFKK